MTFGCARVSTCEQKLDLQLDALQEAGCEDIFTDTISVGLRRRSLSWTAASISSAKATGSPSGGLTASGVA